MESLSADGLAQSRQTVADQRTPRVYTALAALTALGILVQAALAGQFIDRNGRGGWIHAHSVNADLVAALAILTAAYSLVTMRRSARELAIGSVVLAVLVLIQLMVGQAITQHSDDGLIAIHVPLAMVIFGLSIWLNVRPRRQSRNTARSKPAWRAADAR